MRQLTYSIVADGGTDRVLEHVPVIPVRMTEAWLLIDPVAIARAAGRPTATVRLPPLKHLESIPDPKALLEELLIEAAGHPTGRRLQRFTRDLTSRRVNVAAYVQDFSVLEELEAYAAFVDDLRAAYPYRQALGQQNRLA